MYTIVLGHSYDEAWDRDMIKVFGIPRGCQDTFNQRINGSTINYKNVSFDRGVGIDCSAKIVLGVYNEGNKYKIKQGYRTFVNGVFTKKDRTFTGIKIN
jgi:hypothetical protein